MIGVQRREIEFFKKKLGVLFEYQKALGYATAKQVISKIDFRYVCPVCHIFQ